MMTANRANGVSRTTGQRATGQREFQFASVRTQSAAIIGTAANAALEQEKMADLVEQSRTS